MAFMLLVSYIFVVISLSKDKLAFRNPTLDVSWTSLGRPQDIL